MRRWRVSWGIGDDYGADSEVVEAETREEAIRKVLDQPVPQEALAECYREYEGCREITEEDE